MAVIVVGGHARNVGKSSVVAGLIAAFRELRWTAVKITQFGHGICSADGAPCECATDNHSWAVTEEHDRSGRTDSSRFLAAGAQRSLWVRTRQGMLAEAMPKLRSLLRGNVIVESNSVMKFLRPDLYLAVLDGANPDFKRSALEFLDRADAILLHDSEQEPRWAGVSSQLIACRRVLRVPPPKYVTAEVLEFVRARLHQQ